MFKINLRKLILPFIAISVAIACGSTKNSISESKSLEVNEAKENNLYIISTKFGDMKIKLLDETPLHRDNFKKLVADSFYDGTLFHRVIDGFMIQGGDPSSKNAKPGQQLGTGNIEYTIPAEFNSKLIHKKGALAAARQSDAVNPDKESSGCQFYIVDGNKVNERALKSISSRKDIMRKRTLGTKVLDNPSNAQLKKDFIRVRQKGLKDSINFYGAIIQDQIDTLYNGSKFKYTPQQIALYDSIGGTPALDMDYTVFGEVIEGLNIIDSISIQQKDRMNRPFDDVKMTIKKL
ncbi:MAG: peptidylprolyl isomerase [Flavobacteriales bacterium]|nr:peptidylprolyl isomerase [Flavobacteriales bacterium]